MGQVFAIFKPEEKEVSINNSSKEETPVTRAGGINVVDPRSPTTNFERTPIITNGSVRKGRKHKRQLSLVKNQ